MANAGDTYTVKLKETYLDWGEYRKTYSREAISGEGYIPIPKKYAQEFGVFNSNYMYVGLGYNVFIASSRDGFLNNVELLAQGCSSAGDQYAKQFSVKGNLQIIGQWYASQRATTDNYVRVTWVSSTEIILEII